MKEQPKKWEVVCKRCLTGLIMSDEEVTRRLRRDSLWPKHCGQVMMLRQIFVEPDKSVPCSHFGCRSAQYANCSCDCEGRYHGVQNYRKTYYEPKIQPKPWYKQPIRELLTV